MAEIRRLDGSTLDTTKPGRNERIAAVLAHLTAENDAGRLSAIVTVYITPEGGQRIDWQTPVPDFGFPWGLALRGAMAAAEHALGNAVLAVSVPTPDLPDGA